MHILLLSIHSFFSVFLSLYCTNTHRCPSKMRIQDKKIRKNLNIKQGCSFGLSHETSYFFLLFWRFFNVQCRSSHSFCFVCLEHNLFKLRHTIIHELCFYCAFVQKHVTILDLRVMFSRNVSVNWGSVYYLYREMNKTSHHSCSNNKSDYLSLWQWQLTVSQAEFFASMHSGCKSFWRNCFYVFLVLDVYTVHGQFSKQNYLLRKCSSVQMHKNVWIGPLTIQARVPT